MNFIPAQIIKKKRDGIALTAQEIQFFISEYHTGSLPDYQMAAWLMAVVIKGMNKQEAANLTLSMLHSGDQLTFPKLQYLPVDKHSTGGIGDKTSLLIAPLVAACGVPVPMIAGRGLGHTGGTLDKLESIPGMSVQLDLQKFKQQVEHLGCSIIGQTAEICPADKKMYALRDVTGTVESIPLICASILSKKIAEGIKGLVMDVKWGSGAFMKSQQDAVELATWIVETAAQSGLPTTAFITDMNQPLGRCIGNTIEVLECLSLLKKENFGEYSAKDFSDTLDLSLSLSAEMLVLAGHSQTFEQGLASVQRALDSGHAYSLFEKMVIAQGGTLQNFALPSTLRWETIPAEESGFVHSIDGEALGYAAISLGAGRRLTTDRIDHSASVIIHKKKGERVQSGDRLFSYASSKESGYGYADARARLKTCLQISEQAPAENALIAQRISAVATAP